MLTLNLNSILFAASVVLSSCIALTGCADNPNSKIPNLTDITDVGTILTPAERDKTVQTLQKEEEAQSRAIAAHPNDK